MHIGQENPLSTLEARWTHLDHGKRKGRTSAIAHQPGRRTIGTAASAMIGRWTPQQDNNSAPARKEDDRDSGERQDRALDASKGQQ